VVWIGLIGILSSIVIYFIISDLQEDDYWRLFLETAKDYTEELSNSVHNSFDVVATVGSAIRGAPTADTAYLKSLSDHLLAQSAGLRSIAIVSSTCHQRVTEALRSCSLAAKTQPDRIRLLAFLRSQEKNLLSPVLDIANNTTVSIDTDDGCCTIHVLHSTATLDGLNDGAHHNDEVKDAIVVATIDLASIVDDALARTPKLGHDLFLNIAQTRGVNGETVRQSFTYSRGSRLRATPLDAKKAQASPPSSKVWHKTFELLDLRFSATVRPLFHSSDQPSGWLSRTVLLAGFALSGVLCVYILSLGRREKVNADLAARLTLSNRNLRAEVANHQATLERLDRSEQTARLGEARFRAVFEHAAIGIAIVDCTGTIRSVNEQLQDVMFCSADELTNRHVIDLLHPDVRRVHESAVEQFLTDGSTLEIGVVQSSDPSATPRWIFVRGTTLGVSTGSGDEFVVVAEDVTDQVEAHESLRRAAEVAEAANLSKTAFLANMSHELRTPLNAILGFGQLLLLSNYGVLSEKQKEFVESMIDAGNHLLGTLNSILDLSAIEAGHTRMQEGVVNLDDLIKSTLIVMTGYAARSSVTLEYVSPTKMVLYRCDEEKIRSIVTNIVSNAIKFSNSDGAVSVGLDCGKCSCVVIAVQDRGIGISASDINRIVRPFEQVEQSLSRKYEGTGLGLTLAVRYAEMHGGRLKIDSERGVGTTVRLELPSDRLIDCT